MKVAFLSQGKEVGLNRHFLGLLRVLREKGAEVAEFDLSEGDLQERVQDMLSFSPQFVVDVNGSGMLFGQREDGTRVPACDAFGFVHVSIFNEEPLLYYNLFSDTKETANFMPVITDLKYADSIRFMGHERGIFYITPFVDPVQMPNPSEERDIQVVFFGPAIDPNILAQEFVNSIKQEHAPFFFEVAGFMFRNPEVHVLQASEYLLSMFNPDFQEEFNRWKQENPQEYYRLLNGISAYATAMKRWYLLSFLEGVDIKVVGAVQGELKEGHEQVNVQSWQEALELVGRSYITLLSYPHTVPTGVGFTPLEVAFMESAPFVDFRSTLPTFFTPEEEVITYHPIDRAEIEEKLLYYLENPKEAVEVGKRAKQKVLERFTPQDRGEFLHELFSQILASHNQDQ